TADRGRDRECRPAVGGGSAGFGEADTTAGPSWAATVGGPGAATPGGSCGANGASPSGRRPDLRPLPPGAVRSGSSGRPDFFFRAGSARTGSADPREGRSVAPWPFALAPRPGVGIQARDRCEEGDASAARPLGEEADEQAAAALVRGSDQAVPPPMLPSASALGVAMAPGAGANVENTLGMLLGHGTL